MSWSAQRGSVWTSWRSGRLSSRRSWCLCVVLLAVIGTWIGTAVESSAVSQMQWRNEAASDGMWARGHDETRQQSMLQAAANGRVIRKSIDLMPRPINDNYNMIDDEMLGEQSFVEERHFFPGQEASGSDIEGHAVPAGGSQFSFAEQDESAFSNGAVMPESNSVGAYFAPNPERGMNSRLYARRNAFRVPDLNNTEELDVLSQETAAFVRDLMNNEKSGAERGVSSDEDLAMSPATNSDSYSNMSDDDSDAQHDSNARSVSRSPEARGMIRSNHRSGGPIRAANRNGILPASLARRSRTFAPRRNVAGATSNVVLPSSLRAARRSNAARGNNVRPAQQRPEFSGV